MSDQSSGEGIHIRALLGAMLIAVILQFSIDAPGFYAQGWDYISFISIGPLPPMVFTPGSIAPLLVILYFMYNAARGETVDV